MFVCEGRALLCTGVGWGGLGGWWVGVGGCSMMKLPSSFLFGPELLRFVHFKFIEGGGGLSRWNMTLIPAFGR